jgi:thiol-disulfide isomerase/thioredoxin
MLLLDRPDSSIENLRLIFRSDRGFNKRSFGKNFQEWQEMTTFLKYQSLMPGLLFLAATTWPGLARAQDAKPDPARKSDTPSVEAINARYQVELDKLERQRLAQIGELAAKQPKDTAEKTYKEYLLLAIAKGLYTEAEPVAGRLIKTSDTSTELRTLASLVKIVAEADRGAYDESLNSLAEAIREKGRQLNPPGKSGRDLGLTASSRAAIVEAFFQKLIRGNHYDVALKAMKLVAANAESEAVRELAAVRIKRLEMVGRAAPSIAGVDLDGKPFRLEDTKGDVVLVVFWATWCLPVAQEIPWLEETYRTYHDRGFRIVGIDVDADQAGATDPKSVLASVRRFVVEYNIPWPTLINGQGDKDLTRAYSIAEIPANVLIGRDGKVIHLDLSGQKLDTAVSAAIAQKP